MSGEITTQVDISSLSLAGLSQFSTLLAAFSADNVQPIAMLQLQDLGASLPTSGPLAKKVPDLLLRCKSRRVERLGLVIGWRKGDAASLMAQSAGGQAIALVIACLWPIYDYKVGEILFELSHLLLPHDSCISSPALLSQASDALAKKLAIIAFGEIVAKQTVRIYKAYENLPQDAPDSLLERIDPASMAEFFHNASRSLRQQNGGLRVQGSGGMAYLSAITISLFSDDCIVTIEDIIIHQGKRSSSISINILSLPDSDGLEMHFMENIDHLDSFIRGRLTHERAPYSRDLELSRDGFIGTSMRMQFAELGLPCSTELLRALGICALSMSDAVLLDFNESKNDQEPERDPLLLTPLVRILGENERSIIHRRCEIAVGLELPTIWPAFPDARAALTETMKSILSGFDPKKESKAFIGIEKSLKNSKSCRIQTSNLLNDGLWSTFNSFFVCLQSTSTISVPQLLPEDWRNLRKYPRKNVWDFETFYVEPRDVLPSLTPKYYVAACAHGQTYVPAAFLSLDDDDICNSRFVEVFDGCIIHNGRYYQRISASAGNLSNDKKADALEMSPIVPCSWDIPSDITMRVMEKVDSLQLNTQITLSGQIHTIDLQWCVRNLFALRQTSPCEHPRKTPLKKEYLDRVIVANVLPFDSSRYPGKIAIVQTAGHPMAQIIALNGPQGASNFAKTLIFCQKCCLNCAFDQAVKLKVTSIIVG